MLCRVVTTAMITYLHKLPSQPVARRRPPFYINNPNNRNSGSKHTSSDPDHTNDPSSPVQSRAAWTVSSLLQNCLHFLDRHILEWLALAAALQSSSNSPPNNLLNSPPNNLHSTSLRTSPEQSLNSPDSPDSPDNPDSPDSPDNPDNPIEAKSISEGPENDPESSQTIYDWTPQDHALFEKALKKYPRKPKILIPAKADSTVRTDENGDASEKSCKQKEGSGQAAEAAAGGQGASSGKERWGRIAAEIPGKTVSQVSK